MARTIEQIESIIIGKIQSDEKLSTLTSDSKVSIWGRFVYCVAFCIWVLETLFDTHKYEVSNALANQKKGSPIWYRNMALAFQYGFDLIPDTDLFNNDGYTEEQIIASKIIKYAAVTESEQESRLIVKVATEDSSGVLSPINEIQKTAFDYYFDEINYAGVKYTVINYAPDRLKLNLTIKIDPKVIDETGTKILMSATDVGTKPVETAISEFMKELPFDGKLVINSLIDKLQLIDGVIDPIVDSAQTSWIDVESGGYGAMKDINGEALPVSGYFTWSIDNAEFKTVINYVV
ncbi:MAG: nucleotidyltransferase [Bergeyella sp.]